MNWLHFQASRFLHFIKYEEIFMREEYYYGIFRSKHNMGAGRRRAGLLYAGRIRNGRNRLAHEPKTQVTLL